VVAGNTDSPDFPITPGAFDEVFNGWPTENVGEAFVTRYDRVTGGITESTFLGGTEWDDGASAVTVDFEGRVVISGYTMDENFPLAGASFDEDNNGGFDGFVAALDPNLTSLLYGTYLGGIYYDDSSALALDGQVALVFGNTGSPDFPTTSGAFDETFNSPAAGVYDTYLTRLALLTPAAVTDGTRPSALRLEARPWASGVSFHFDLGEGVGVDAGGGQHEPGGRGSVGSVSLAVYRSDGRLVRRLLEGEAMTRGTRTVWWDGRNEAGDRAPSGIHFARLRVGSASTGTALLLIR
jgi:hypothetical protein